jgi:hypothetical protein
VLRTIARDSAIGKGLSAAETAGKFSTQAATVAAAKVADLSGRALQKGSSAVGALVGRGGLQTVAAEIGASAVGVPGGSVIGTALASRVAKRVGESLVKTGAKLRGEIPPGPVWSALKKVAVSAPVKGAAQGAVAATGLAGDPFALAFSVLSVAGADTQEELASNLAGQVGVGALFGGAAGVHKQFFDIGSKLFAPVSPDGRPVTSPAYGIFPELDAAHSNSNPSLGEVGQRVNQFREAVRETGKQIYSVDDATYLDTIRKFREQEKGSALSDSEEAGLVQDALTKGVYIQKITAPDGSTQDIVLTRVDGGALNHEGGHLLDSLLSDDERTLLRDAVTKNYSKEALNNFRGEYEKALGHKISDAQLHDEIVAENVSAVLSAIPIDKLGAPAPFARRVYQAVGGAVEKLGLRLNEALGSNVVSDVPFGQNYQTALGLTPAIGVTAPAEGLIRARLQKPTPAAVRPAQIVTRPQGPEMLVHAGEKTVGVSEGIQNRGTNVFVGDTSGTTVQTPDGPVTIRPLAEGNLAQNPLAPATMEAPPVIAAVSPNARVTPAQQNEFRATESAASRGTEAESTGIAEADIAVANSTKLSDEQKAAYGTLRGVVEKGTANQSPVEIEYLAVRTEETASGRLKRKAEQETAYAAEKQGALPEETRTQMQKLFVPFRFFEKKGGEVGILAMSLDKVRANIDRLVKGLVNAKKTDLIPYSLVDGKFTSKSAAEIIKDVQTYAANQANGYAGTGERVTVPGTFFGTIPPETPGYSPVAVSEVKSRFINTLMGTDLGPPLTLRTSEGRPVAANVSARQLAEANARPVEVSLRAKVGKEATPGVVELNPLRGEMRRSGLGETLENLETVTERVDLKNIKSAKVRDDLTFNRPVTDLVRAGFMPDAEFARKYPKESEVAEKEVPGQTPIEIKSADGKISPAVFNGYYEENVPSIGRFVDHSVSHSMLRKGETVESSIPTFEEWKNSRPTPKAAFLPDGTTLMEVRSSNDETTVWARKDGKPIGRATFKFQGDEAYPVYVETDSKLRRQGVATAMYDYMRERYPHKISEDAIRTADGKAFREGMAKKETSASFLPDADRPEATLDTFTGPKIKGALNEKGWAILTAENPSAKPLSVEENATRNNELTADLTAQGLDYAPVQGKYGRDENSFIVTGIEPKAASDLGTKYGQESVLVPEGLLYSDGTVNPASDITVHETPPEDFFTTLPDGTTFTANIDFDTRRPAASFMPAKRDAGTAEFDLGITREDEIRQSVKAKAKEKKVKFPEAIPAEYVKGKDGKIDIDEDGKPRTVKQDYALDETPLAKEARKGLKGDARQTAVVNSYAREMVKDFKRSAAKNPAIMAGKEWYQIARSKISKLFGDDTLFFAQLLAATSARTPVGTNYRFAIDAYKKFKNGDYDAMIKKYNEGLDKIGSGELMTESGKGTQAAALNWWIEKHDLSPVQTNGEKFAANSGAVMRVLAGVWADMVQGPKTPNFAGNLAGTTLEATIDVWAARGLRRFGFANSEGKQWRLLPESETGVSDLDFALGQAVYRKAAAELGMNPDDLQGVMWFAEKDHWEKNGWTRGAGAEKSDFNYFLDRTSRKKGKIDLDETPEAEPELNLQ